MDNNSYYSLQMYSLFVFTNKKSSKKERMSGDNVKLLSLLNYSFY